MLLLLLSCFSCVTLCDPIDGSPPGSPVPGILQARTLDWVAIFFSNAWKWKVKVKSLSRVRLLVTPWTAAYQAPPSMGFSRQESWSGLPMPSSRESSWPRDRTHVSFCFLCWRVGGFFTLVPPGKPRNWLWFPFPGGLDGKVSAYNAGDPGSIPGLGRSSGEGSSNPLQYSCLENGVHGVAKSQTWLSNYTSLPFITLMELCHRVQWIEDERRNWNSRVDGGS